MDLSGCKNISDDGLRALSSLRSLQRLSFSGCKNISDDGWRALSSLSSLQELNLYVAFRSVMMECVH